MKIKKTNLLFLLSIIMMAAAIIIITKTAYLVETARGEVVSACNEYWKSQIEILKDDPRTPIIINLKPLKQFEINKT